MLKRLTKVKNQINVRQSKKVKQANLKYGKVSKLELDKAE